MKLTHVVASVLIGVVASSSDVACSSSESSPNAGGASGADAGDVSGATDASDTGSPVEASAPPKPSDPPPAPAGYGPNAFAGLETPFPIFRGDELPATASTFGTLTPNQYGMGATYSQSRNWTIEDDPDSPSGKALQLNFYGSGHPRAPAAFPPPDAGGGSPSRGYLRAGIDAHDWTRLHIYLIYKFSPNFSTLARLQTLNTHYTGTTAAGTTVTRVYFAGSPGWATNVHVNRVLRGSSGYGSLIVANGPDYVDLEPNDRLDSVPGLGTTYDVISYTPTATTHVSAGIKGWFWARQFAHLVGDQTTPGGGAGFGTPWSIDATGRWGENHYQAGWRGNGTAANPPGGVIDGFGLQLNRRWDAPYPTDANGLPIWSGDRYTEYPANFSQGGAELPYVRGTAVKAEYYLQLNTPGVADGIFRVWHDGVLKRNETNVMYCERYASAQYVQNGGTVNMPVLGGSPRDVALEIIADKWAFLWSDTTFGGIQAMHVPDESHMWMRYLYLAVGGAP
jgi:hypothetical protein